MTNRDWLLNRCEYDVLIGMQENIIDHGCVCVLDAVSGHFIPCPKEMGNKVGEQSRLEVCGGCIAAWLNKEHRRNENG